MTVFSCEHGALAVPRPNTLVRTGIAANSLLLADLRWAPAHGEEHCSDCVVWLVCVRVLIGLVAWRQDVIQHYPIPTRGMFKPLWLRLEQCKVNSRLGLPGLAPAPAPSTLPPMHLWAEDGRPLTVLTSSNDRRPHPLPPPPRNTCQPCFCYLSVDVHAGQAADEAAAGLPRVAGERSPPFSRAHLQAVHAHHCSRACARSADMPWLFRRQ